MNVVPNIHHEYRLILISAAVSNMNGKARIKRNVIDFIALIIRSTVVKNNIR